MKRGRRGVLERKEYSGKKKRGGRNEEVFRKTEGREKEAD